MLSTYEFILDFTYIAILIIAAAILKATFKSLQKWILPTAIIAGFLGLFLGPEFLNLLPFNPDNLSNLVYHLMGIGFIAMSLKQREVANHPSTLNSGMLIVSTYLIQGIVGFGTMILLVLFFYPSLFEGIGLLLPLGFGQGPGQAYSIGSSWESLGIENGGNLGLTVAGIGFIWASFIGLILLNFLSRNKKVPQKDSIHSEIKKEEHSKNSQSLKDVSVKADSIDPLSYQIAVIGVIYFVTYLTVLGLDKLLSPLGNMGNTVAELLIGFHFIIGSLYAMVYKKIVQLLKGKGFMTEQSFDNNLLSRISGTAFDFMITASISAISIYALKEYTVPIIIFTTIGGVVTVFYLIWIVPRLFPKDSLPNILGFYGMLTGTISTGLALIKGIDSKFQTNASDNLVLGSASGILFGAPLMLVLSIPIVGYKENNPALYGLTLVIFIIYFGLLLGALLYRTRKNKNGGK